jgi:hypothetical protein
MIRPFIEEITLFLLPFAGFALWLLFRRKTPLEAAHWDGRTPILALIGLALAGAALFYTGWTAERSMGTYVPAHMENGTFVPGGFK